MPTMETYFGDTRGRVQQVPSDGEVSRTPRHLRLFANHPESNSVVAHPHETQHAMAHLRHQQRRIPRLVMGVNRPYQLRLSRPSGNTGLLPRAPCHHNSLDEVHTASLRCKTSVQS